MRRFTCERCAHAVAFAAQNCAGCAHHLGYLSHERNVRILEPTSNPAVFLVAGSEDAWWRCLNSAWGCNWMLPAESESPWCRSCQMTRGRPDEARPDAIQAWIAAEAAKRRLVHQLDELELPIEIRSASIPDGLAFDLVDVPGEGGITGHLDGVITLDLAETDEQHRDDLRRVLGEPYRTVIGHLRHEIGHYYWARLVAQTEQIDEFRRLFGNERVDYQAAVEQHYAGDTTDWDSTHHVSAYAASHPLEDFAESFAHYLHILDAIDTADAHHLSVSDCAQLPDVGTDAYQGFEDILDAWRPINEAINAVADALGTPAIYPFDPTGLVVDKLAFVHRQVLDHVARHRFYEAH